MEFLHRLVTAANGPLEILIVWNMDRRPLFEYPIRLFRTWVFFSLIEGTFDRYVSFLHCALSLVAQCIVIDHVCGFVCLFVGVFLGLLP